VANMTPYLQSTLLNQLLVGTGVTLGLFITDPSGGDGVEVAGGDTYVRLLVNFVVTAEPEASNSDDITFPTPTGTWGLVGWVGLFDSSGNLLFTAPMTVPQTITAGFPLSVLAGQLVVNLSN